MEEKMEVEKEVQRDAASASIVYCLLVSVSPHRPLIMFTKPKRWRGFYLS